MATVAHDNIQLVERFIDEIVNGGDYDLIEELFTSDYKRHDAPTGSSVSGRDTWRESVGQIREAFPDGKVHVGEIISDGDFVAFEGRMTGTHDGPFVGIEPTHKSFDVRGNAMHRIEDGRIAETWATWDYLSMFSQLGVVEAPGE